MLQEVSIQIGLVDYLVRQVSIVWKVLQEASIQTGLVDVFS